MEDYNKILESVNIRTLKHDRIKLTHPVMIDNFYDVDNNIFLLDRCKIRFGKYDEVAMPGEIFFVPGGRMTSIAFGTGPTVRLTNDEYKSAKRKYLVAADASVADDAEAEFFSHVSFETRVFESVNFFTSLDIPPFVIRKNERIANLVKGIIEEKEAAKPGYKRILNARSTELVVEIIRHIIDNRLFLEQLTTNATYFKDVRLVDLFNYIKNHLGGDLSNKVLARVAGVSEDYVGQYFKIMTGINPQDYIEYQRMEYAVSLLRDTKKSIAAIGRQVGYKDTAYFCRRFKMMFGIPAAKMRKRERLMQA